MKTYVEIIKVLIENGYSVNNGYAHRYILQGDKFALIGAGYGITTIGQRIMINKSHKHRLREYKNKMMDIYLLNVTNLENIMQSAESVINQLREVVGDANVQIINSNLVFALPIVKTKIFDYRMFSWKKIIKIKKILNKENIV